MLSVKGTRCTSSAYSWQTTILTQFHRVPLADRNLWWQSGQRNIAGGLSSKQRIGLRRKDDGTLKSVVYSVNWFPNLVNGRQLFRFARQWRQRFLENWQSLQVTDLPCHVITCDWRPLRHVGRVTVHTCLPMVDGKWSKRSSDGDRSLSSWLSPRTMSICSHVIADSAE